MAVLKGEIFGQLRNIISSDKVISFEYNGKKRSGKVVDCGYGKSGAFVTIENDKETKRFSLKNMKDLVVQ